MRENEEAPCGVCSTTDAYGFGPGATMPHSASTAFDTSLLEIYCRSLSGARLAVADDSATTLSG
ncbi:hypothetical protein [Streptomyces lunaelactis]|uniref:hypothetical protein n=1 Tax=Streptomyces lunaelactis TaxID=1535768 RepID=UPI00131F44B1|nr:hypothetical protein [Streptomyces lunaelactis]NUK85121.1 hypothetical protein [Streptomyces lunaelactis]NUL04497.1 hypothetical protein [Streptomyces lunaelactis]